MDRLGIPEGTRPAARVVLLDGKDRILLLEARHAPGGRTSWLAPGGGLRDNETFAQAAAREMWEETGLDVAIGRWIWTRRHRFVWNGRPLDQYERFFLARTKDHRIAPVEADDYVIGHRWWTLPGIRASSETFSPRRLAELLHPILEGAYPERPIDCGVEF